MDVLDLDGYMRRRRSRPLGMTLHLAEVRSRAEFEGTFAQMAAAQVDAIIVQQDELVVVNRALLIHLAAQRRLPGCLCSVCIHRQVALMCYGATAEALDRRAAEYVDRILKGARPSDLAVARPTQA